MKVERVDMVLCLLMHALMLSVLKRSLQAKTSGIVINVKNTGTYIRNWNCIMCLRFLFYRLNDSDRAKGQVTQVSQDFSTWLMLRFVSKKR